MSIREGLSLLADFYLDRLADLDRPELLLEDADRAAAKAPIRAALEEVRRRLVIQPV